MLRYPTGATAAVAFGVAVAGGGFSIFYSGWVSRIIKQSEERAGIIDQLEATRVELAAAQHEAGRLAERQRLSADIHDTLAQGFTSILMLIQAAQADLDGSHPRAAGTWTWPRPPPGRTWPRRGRWSRTSRPRSSTAVRCPTRCAGCRRHRARRRASPCPARPQPLPMAAEVVLLRVCQEALANARKHANAHSVTVRLGYDPDAVRLEVSDDGAGFDPDQVSGGYGLRGMRTRVAEAGGTLTVCSNPGAGTQVSAEVPA